MIYVLVCLSLLCNIATLYILTKKPKETKAVRVEEQPDITQEELAMYKAEAELAERKYSEGVLNVLNYDVNVAKKALRGE